MVMEWDTGERAQVEFTPRSVGKLITHELYLWAQVEAFFFLLNGLNVTAFKIDPSKMTQGSVWSRVTILEKERKRTSWIHAIQYKASQPRDSLHNTLK